METQSGRNPNPDEDRRCRATSKRTGKRCGRVCSPNKTICYFHGGAPGSGAPPGNTNARKHGLYSHRLLPEQLTTYTAALEVKGLAQEIALLRVVIADNLKDPDVLTRAVAMLVRTVAQEHKMSAEHEQGLYDNIVATLQGFANAIAEPTGE